ncbi:hypothetical protein [Methylorubrum zatmanii]|uniref:Photosystem reaction center subunit H n=1 Tax=Methylorubrum zatmanii TaxID=29429 RepID=A0ABW1WK89_9HYPH|nr:hypothetical protein [Methylorubrum zatmanii]MBD8909395.1 hypothetical protein [Methylorubrum zatmanii]
MRSRGITLAALLILGGATAARAQTVVDGSDAAVGPEAARAVLSLIGTQLRDPEARIAGLRIGRSGALCGTVDVRNRMGVHTGPRGFVADLPEKFIGRLPEGPELRSPASMADFRAMERARALYEANCTAG